MIYHKQKSGGARWLTNRVAAALMILLASSAESQQPVAAPTLSYADLADVALAAPVAAHVKLKRATAVEPERSPGLAAGRTRFYVTAEVVSLIRGSSGLPAEVAYLVDVGNGADNKPVKLRRNAEYLVFGRVVAGRPGELQLAAPDAQLAYAPAAAETLRAMLREAGQTGAAPAVTGIGRAFHAPGSLPGESETQIFLLAADGRPISLSILRRPGEQPRWGVALTEIAANVADPPAPNSLLWYRLACTLPRALPQQSLAEAEPGQQAAIRADYAVVLESLGRCARTRRS